MKSAKFIKLQTLFYIIFLAAVRLEQLAHATFTLVPVRDELSCIGPRLSEALLSGSIPIIVTYSGSLVLDYLSGGSINWKKATIQISYARLPELPFMISSITPDHIFHLRRQGKKLLIISIINFVYTMKNVIILVIICVITYVTVLKNLYF